MAGKRKAERSGAGALSAMRKTQILNPESGRNPQE
jgi:hypothetical protein